MTLTSDIVTEIISDTFEMIAGISVKATDTAMSVDKSTCYITGCIQYIQGTWHGATLMQIPGLLAKQLGALMFEGDADAQVSDAEVRDAVGEITNIVAGNFRRVMPEGASMSLPTVVEGIQYSFNIMEAKLTFEQNYDCLGQTFRLCVLMQGE